MIKREIESGEAADWTTQSDRSIVQLSSEKFFTYDRAYGETSTNAEVFAGSAA